MARLESGNLPSTRTLERFAKATHTKLRIRFEPEKPGQEVPRGYIEHKLRLRSVVTLKLPV